MNKLLAILLAAMLTLSVSACVKKSVPPADNPPKEPSIADVTPYFPAEPGITWTYEGKGNEYAGFKRTVVRRENGLVQLSENNGGTQMGLVYKASAEAVTLVYALEEHYTDASLLSRQPNRNEVLFKAPLKPGAAWQDDRFKREVISISASITVPGGTFDNAVQIKSTPLNQTTSGYLMEYYVPNIGLVAREYKSNELHITSKLKSWGKK